MASPPLVTIIIINYNSGDRLAKCLAHLARQTFTNFEVIVLDNASKDASMNAATSWDAHACTLIHSETNLGFAAGNNCAAKTARGDWLAFLNPDAYAAPDWLEMLIEATRTYGWADAFGSTQIDALKPDQLDGVGDVYHAFGVPYRGGFGHPSTDIPPDGECFSPCAAAMLIKRDVFETLHGFDERYFCYGEDVDLGFRLRLSGGRCVQIANAIVHHEGSAISGRYSDFTVYHGNRNRVWGWFKNMPLILIIALLPFHLLVNVYLLLRSFSVGIGKPFWRAMVDGYGGLPPIMKARREHVSPSRASLGSIVSALTWSPIKVSRRAADLKPIASRARSQKV